MTRLVADGLARESGAVTPRPFPWAVVPRVGRAAARSRSAVQGALALPALPARAVEALTDLVGAPVSATANSASADLATTLTSHTVSFRLAPPEDPPSWWVGLDVEVSLVVLLVARAMRRAPVRVIHEGVATPAMLGAFAAVLAAAVRRAGVPVIVAPGDSSTAPGASAEEVTIAGLTVEVDGQATHVRASFPSRLLNVRRPFARVDAEALGEMPLALPIVAAQAVATAAEVAALAVGDVWVLGEAWRLASGANGALRGPVWLSAAMGERGVPADLEDHTRIVLRGGLEELSWSPMNEPSEVDGSAALVEAVGEVPVVVRVEIGAVTMKAKEWSALRPGDVIGLDTPIGGPVTLRVSGVEVAEGELVDLEGQLGVRIRRRVLAPSP